MSDAFGELPQDPTEKPIRMAVGRRASNSIEIELRAMAAEALAAVPMAKPIFIEDDEQDDIEGLPVRVALDVQDVVQMDIGEKYRRQIVIASELGPRATVAEYIAACLLEGVDPLIAE